MSKLISVDQVGAFAKVRDFRPEDVTDELRSAVQRMHEADDLEPAFRKIIHDHADTPHGPAEIVDIFTHKVWLNDENVLSAFILKGRSFRTVRP